MNFMQIFTGRAFDGWGMWVVVARDEAECVAILKKDYEGKVCNPGESMDDEDMQQLRTAVAKAPRFDLDPNAHYFAQVVDQYHE